MTCGLVHASYSLPEWQAVTLTFFAPWLRTVLMGAIVPILPLYTKSIGPLTKSSVHS